MKTFFALIFVSLFSFAVFAQEESTTKIELPVIEDGLTDLSLSHSHFFGLAPEGKMQATVTYQSVNPAVEKQNFQLDSNSIKYEKTAGNSYGFKLSRGLTDYASASIALGYQTSKYNILSNNIETGSSAGMMDIALNVTLLSEITDGQFLYGMDLTLSPGEKIYPTATSQGNSFSGGHAVTPFIGIEKMIGQTVAGGRFASTFFTGQFKQTRESYYGNSHTGLNPTDLTAFFEYTINQKTDIGFQAGLGKHFNDTYTFADFYSIGFYGNYAVDNFTSVDMNLAMKNHEYFGTAESFAEFTFALKRTL